MVGEDSPIYQIHQHFIKTGPHGPLAKAAVFNCPKRMANLPCPACEAADRLRSGSAADRDASKEYNPSRRFMAVVIDRANEDKGPQILAFGKTIMDDLMDLYNDGDDGGDFTNPSASGFDIVITRKGERLNTKYSLRPRPKKPLTADNAQLGRWIEMAPDLTVHVQLLDYDHIYTLLNGDEGDNVPSLNAGNAIDTSVVSVDPF